MKGVEKIQKDHQKIITDRENQIKAHQQTIEEKYNDDLKNREHDNVALQAQRDVYKEQLQKCQTSLPILKNVMFLMQKIQAKATLL